MEALGVDLVDPHFCFSCSNSPHTVILDTFLCLYIPDISLSLPLFL